MAPRRFVKRMKALSDNDPNDESYQQDHDEKREKYRLSRLKRDFASNEPRLSSLNNLSVRV